MGLWHRGFLVNFARFLRAPFLQNTSGWLVLFYNSCWLYTLQLYIAGIALQLYIVGEKIHPYISRIFFFSFFSFFHFLWQMPIYLDGYSKYMLYSELPIVLLAQRHLNTLLLTNFDNLNSILNIFQEIHDFLVLTDPVIICIYLRTTDRHFRGRANVRYPTSKFLKCNLVQTLNTFRNRSLRIFVAGKASVVEIYFSKVLDYAPIMRTFIGKLKLWSQYLNTISKISWIIASKNVLINYL